MVNYNVRTTKRHVGPLSSHPELNHWISSVPARSLRHSNRTLADGNVVDPAGRGRCSPSENVQENDNTSISPRTEFVSSHHNDNNSVAKPGIAASFPRLRSYQCTFYCFRHSRPCTHSDGPIVYSPMRGYDLQLVGSSNQLQFSFKFKKTRDRPGNQAELFALSYDYAFGDLSTLPIGVSILAIVFRFFLSVGFNWN